MNSANFDDDDDAARAAAFADDDDDDYDDYDQDPSTNNNALASPTPMSPSPPPMSPSSPPMSPASPPTSPSSPAVAAAAAAALPKEEEWMEHEDDKGQTYYYNSKTGESSWDVPPGYNNNNNTDATDAAAADVEVVASTASTPPRQETEEIAREEEQPPLQEKEKEAVSVEEDVSAEPAEDLAAEPEKEEEWVLYQDDGGQDYYYNSKTGETQWEKPNSSASHPSSSSQQQQQQQQDEQQLHQEEGHHGSVSSLNNDNISNDNNNESAVPNDNNDDDDDDEGEEEEGAAMEEEEIVEEEEEVVVEETALEKAQGTLKQPDAILESNCPMHVSEVLNNMGGQQGGQFVMTNLIQGYVGQTAIAALLANWLTTFRRAKRKQKQKHTPSTTPADAAAIRQRQIISSSQHHTNNNNTNNNNNNNNSDSSSAVQSVRNFMEQVIAKLAKDRYNVEGGDYILTNLSKQEAAFLQTMMKDTSWRRLLIDLSAQHQHSALLMYCLNRISEMGHHREIVSRINQSDYFTVFHNMLTSELSTMIQNTNNTKNNNNNNHNNNNNDNDYTMDRIIQDLQRTCTSTSYTYIYAMTVLQHLVQRANLLQKQKPNKQIYRAQSIWERLKEELEHTMISPNSTIYTTNNNNNIKISPLSRKRRVDIALTVSELHQRQRRRYYYHDKNNNHQPTNTSNDNNNNNNTTNNSNSRVYSLDSGMETLLKRYSMGMQMDTALASQLLHNPYESEQRVGELLIAHPTAITALLSNLYKACFRAKSLEIRLKCCKLIACAVLAAHTKQQSQLQHQPQSQLQQPPPLMDNETIYKVLLKGSQLCEQGKTRFFHYIQL